MPPPSRPPTRIPTWLILVGIAIIFPRLFSFLLPIIIFWWIFGGGLGALEKFKEKMQNIKKDGIDISQFQNSSRQKNTKTKAQRASSFSSVSFSNPMENFSLRPKHFVGLFTILILAFIIIDGLVSVPAGHVAVVYDRGRGVLQDELPEGLHLKIPFWQTATIMDARLQAYTMSIAEGEGERYGDDSIEALTKDGQTVDVDLTIQYRIDGNEASIIYQDIGNIPDLNEKVIRPEVRSVVREVVTGYESKQLFNIETRQQASIEMETQLREQYAQNNVVLDSLLLRNVRFSQIYLNAIEEKQVAEQKIQKAEFERQEAEKLKEKNNHRSRS